MPDTMTSGRDRLAAMRAQREQESFSTGAPGGPQAGAYEMSGLQPTASPVSIPVPGQGGMSSFQQEVEGIQDLLREFEGSVARISTLHAQALQIMEPDAAARHQTALDEQVGAARAQSTGLQQRIAALKARPAAGPDARIQKNQTELVAKKFVAALQTYQNVERDYRAKYRTRVERQFKLVKPDATAEEVASVVNDTDGSGGQIFAQALTTSNRYQESRLAYREAQERHQEILRIEQNIAELAQLMNDMSVLVAQADEQLDTIQHNAESVDQDMEQGNQQIDKAILYIRRTRKMRWVCFIILIILIIIAALLAIYFTNGHKL